MGLFTFSALGSVDKTDDEEVTEEVIEETVEEEEASDETTDDAPDLAAATQTATDNERVRWATVLSEPKNAGNIQAACHMLANTDMSAGQINGTLATLPENSSTGFTDQMQGASNPGIKAHGPDVTREEKVSAADLMAETLKET